MRIAVINQPLANRGDEAAHKAFIRAMSKVFTEYQIDVVFLSVEQGLINSIKVEAENVSYINIPRIRGFVRFEQIGFLSDNFAFSYLHPSLRKFHNLLNDYDRVVCAPGGMCMGGFSNWNHIWQLDVARRLKKPVFYWGRSIGPFSEECFKKKLFKKCSSRLLKYFSYISLRDKVSVDIAGQFEVNADEVVDSAFLEIPATKIPESILKDIDGAEYVVFVPNSLTWHPRYKEIGARYHSVVFAINNEIPFVSLSYEHKMKGLLEVLNMTDRMVEIQDIFDGKSGEFEKALDKVEHLVSGKQEKPSASQAREIVWNGFEKFAWKIKNMEER